MKKSIALLAPVALFLSGCDISDMVDGNILPTARAFFPAAQINHPRRDIIEINTHVSNVTEAFAQQVMAKLVSRSLLSRGPQFRKHGFSVSPGWIQHVEPYVRQCAVHLGC